MQEQSGRIVFYGIPWLGAFLDNIPTPAGAPALSSLPDPGGQSMSSTNAAQARITQQIHTLYGDPANALAFSPDGKLIAVGGASGTVTVWRVADGTLVYALTGHRAAVRAVAFSNGGALLVSGGDDGGVYIWEVATGRKVNWSVGGGDPVSFVKFLENDQMLVYGNTKVGTLIKVRSGPGLWNSAHYQLKDMRDAYAKTLPAVQVEAGYTDSPLHVDDVNPTGTIWFADGMAINVDTQVVLGYGTSFYYHSETDRSHAILAPDRQSVLTPGAVYLITGGKDRDLITGPLVAHSWYGSTLIAYLGGQGIRLADLKDTAFTLDLPSSPTSVNAISFSDDGRHIAACDSSGNVWIWGVPVGQ